MTKLNAAIAEDQANLGHGFCIGHSFFCDSHSIPDDGWYKSVVEVEIVPLFKSTGATSRKGKYYGLPIGDKSLFHAVSH